MEMLIDFPGGSTRGCTFWSLYGQTDQHLQVVERDLLQHLFSFWRRSRPVPGSMCSASAAAHLPTEGIQIVQRDEEIHRPVWSARYISRFRFHRHPRRNIASRLCVRRSFVQLEAIEHHLFFKCHDQTELAK